MEQQQPEWTSAEPAGLPGPKAGVIGMVAQAGDQGLALAQQMRQEAQRTMERSRRSIDFILGRADPEVGLTPKETVLSRGTMKLYRYRPQTDEVYRVPLIFVMSLVSKPYILDLAPNQSFVEYLVRQGFDVYMIDWGIPRDEDRTMRFEDYVLDLLPRAVERVRKISGEEDYSFLGYCFGGTLSLMYAMAFPRDGLRNLVTVATPLDFSGMGLLSHWADRRWFDVDRVVDTFGNIPAEVVLRSLEMLRPLDRMLGYVRLWDNAWDPDFVYNWRLRYKWVQDQIAFPGETYRQLIKDLFWENKLINGELMLDGRRLSPGCVNASVFNIMAQFDHIAPYESTSPLTGAIGSLDKQDLVVRGGHVSLISGANALLRLWPSVNQWLSVRSV